MTSVFVIQLSFKLLMGLIGVVAARLALFWFDKHMVDDDFKTMVNGWNDNAKAMYYSGRFMAVALCVGLAIS